MGFVPHKSRLHYLDLKEKQEAGIALMTMIQDNFEGYMKKQVEGAIKAWHLQAMLGHQSRKDYESMVHANLIANCPVTPSNISHAHKLFGENLAGLRGKTVHRKPEQVVMDYVKIPRDLIQTNKYVTLTADVMFVNNLAFVIMYWRVIGLIMAEFTPNSMARQLACNLRRIIALYSRAGFTIQTILMDMEFNKVIPELPEVIINTSVASEHVAEVE